MQNPPLTDPNSEAETISRRNLMMGLAGTAAVVGAVGVSALPVGWYEGRKAQVPASWWERKHWTLATAGVSEWNSRVGNNFVLLGASREVLLRLTAVNPFPSLGERPADVSRKQAFAAVFDSGRVRLPAQDRIYRIGHIRYGEMDIFLKPCGDATCPGRLEATFN